MEPQKTITDKLFDSKYIEQCVNNPDLQALWSLEIGTYFYNPKLDRVELIDKSFMGDKDKGFWIPRQDELQILLKEKRDRYNEMTDLKFDFNMRQCIFKSYCHKILCRLSLNDMWLIFFMQDQFGKQWIPERKTWEHR